MDSRLGFLHGTSPDGRKLLVEVLHSVHGLEKADLAHVETIRYAGTDFKVLDPVVMLLAKAANVRDIDQTERHDRLHLELIARCVPIYLQRTHQAAVMHPPVEKEALAVISRAFKTLQHEKTAQTLQAEGIVPSSLIPVALADSPLPRVKRAYDWHVRVLASAAG